MPRKILLSFLFAVFFAAGYGACWYSNIGSFILSKNNIPSDVKNKNIPEIRIAANFPLSGDLAFYGNAFRDGILMATSEKGELIKDKGTISFDWGDNRFSPKDAITLFQRQLLNKPTIYTSALKPQVMAVNDAVAHENIPHFVWILDIHANSATTTNNLRSWVSFKLESDVFIEYARAKKARRVAIVILSLPSTEEQYGKVIIPALKENSETTIFIERFTPNVSPDDFRVIAAKVGAFKPDLIMLNGFIPQMVGLIRSLRPLGIIKQGNTLAALDMLDAANVISPEEAEGIVVAAPPFILKPTEDQKAWSERFNKLYGRQPPYHSAFAYDMGLTLIDTASRLNLPASSQDWQAALKATDTKGITGPIKFDQDGSLVTTLKPAIYQNGKLVELSPTASAIEVKPKVELSPKTITTIKNKKHAK